MSGIHGIHNIQDHMVKEAERETDRRKQKETETDGYTERDTWKDRDKEGQR